MVRVSEIIHVKNLTQCLAPTKSLIHDKYCFLKLDAPRKSRESELFNILNLPSRAKHGRVSDFLSSQVSQVLELNKLPTQIRYDSLDRDRAMADGLLGFSGGHTQCPL